jgi:GUN4-like/ARM-like repeat domain, GUN4-N terminal
MGSGSEVCMTNVDQPIRPNVAAPDSDLDSQFRSATEKQQLPLVDTLIAAGDAGVAVLLGQLRDYQAAGCPVSPIGLVPPVTAKAYHQLYQTGQCHDDLKSLFPQGVVPLQSAKGVDYQPLQQLLVQQHWQEADKLHNLKFCEAAGESALARKWIYFTEVNLVPIADLRTLNALWMAHSQGRFGYSVQRELWLNVGQNWEKFWPKIHWKDGNTWTRYPGGFDWSLAAPPGHLPLSNQLRGIQVMKALMNHPAWIADVTV